MSSFVRRLPSLAGLLLTLGASGLTGCDSPCRALAERICECEFNAIERASCIQEIDSNQSVREPTSEENERCSELLDTCSCEALDRGERAACGLTKTRDGVPGI